MTSSTPLTNAPCYQLRTPTHIFTLAEKKRNYNLVVKVYDVAKGVWGKAGSIERNEGDHRDFMDRKLKSGHFLSLKGALVPPAEKFFTQQTQAQQTFSTPKVVESSPAILMFKRKEVPLLQLSIEEKYPCSYAVFPKMRLLAGIFEDGKVRIWRFDEDVKIVKKVHQVIDTNAREFVKPPKLKSLGNNRLIIVLGGTFQVWKYDLKVKKFSFHQTVEAHYREITALEVCDANLIKWVVTAAEDKKLKYWKASQSGKFSCVDEKEIVSPIMSMKYAKTSLFCSLKNGKLQEWKVGIMPTKLEKKKSFASENTTPYISLARPIEGLLACGLPSGEVEVYDIGENSGVIQRIGACLYPITTVISEGTQLLSASSMRPSKQIWEIMHAPKKTSDIIQSIDQALKAIAFKDISIDLKRPESVEKLRDEAEKARHNGETSAAIKKYLTCYFWEGDRTDFGAIVTILNKVMEKSSKDQVKRKTTIKAFLAINLLLAKVAFLRKNFGKGVEILHRIIKKHTSDHLAFSTVDPAGVVTKACVTSSTFFRKAQEEVADHYLLLVKQIEVKTLIPQLYEAAIALTRSAKKIALAFRGLASYYEKKGQQNLQMHHLLRGALLLIRRENGETLAHQLWLEGYSIDPKAPHLKGTLIELVHRGYRLLHPDLEAKLKSDYSNASVVLNKFLDYKPGRKHPSIREQAQQGVGIKHLHLLVEDEAETSDEEEMSSDDEDDGFVYVNKELKDQDGTLLFTGKHFSIKHYPTVAVRRKFREKASHSKQVLSPATKKLAEKNGPIRAEAIVKGYFNWLGTANDYEELKKDYTPGTKRKGTFSCLLHRFTQVYVNKNSYGNLVKDKGLTRNFRAPCNRMPVISTSYLAEKAIPYAVGKIKPVWPIKVRRSTGEIKHRRRGYLEVYKVSEQFLKQRCIDIDAMSKDGKIYVASRMAKDREVVVMSSVPAENILGYLVYSLPSFREDWTQKLKEQFGLDKEKYDQFRKDIKSPKQKHKALEKLKKEVSQHYVTKVEWFSSSTAKNPSETNSNKEG